MRITSKGEVTIPRYIREQSRLMPGSEVDFQLGDDREVRLFRADEQPLNLPLKRAIERLRGKADNAMSTEEIMALTRG